MNEFTRRDALRLFGLGALALAATPFATTAIAGASPSTAGSFQATPLDQIRNDYFAGRTVYGGLSYTVNGWWIPNLRRVQGSSGKYYTVVRLSTGKEVALSETADESKDYIPGTKDEYWPPTALYEIITGTSSSFLTLLVQIWELFWIIVVVIMLAVFVKEIFNSFSVEGDLRHNSWGIDLGKEKEGLRDDMNWIRGEYPEVGPAIQELPGGDVVNHWLDTGESWWS